MTTTTPEQILAQTWPVFLDFDGPVTHLFINGRASQLADQLRRILAGHGIDPTEIADSPDPLVILRWAYAHADPQLFGQIERKCIAGETSAATLSDSTPGSTALIEACRAAQRPLTILSNNAPEAIHAYLREHSLNNHVSFVVGRTPGDPTLMKPHRHLIDQALSQLNVVPARVAFIGDSVTDIQVGIATGLRTIGYAKRPDRGTELDLAGAEALTNTIEQLAASVSALDCRIDLY